MSETELRRRFAQGDYLNRALAGEFGCCLARTRRANSPDEPAGPRSVAVAYVDDAGHRVFLVHFDRRPDGTIGGSGKLDPKWLFEDGVVYAVERRGGTREPRAIRQRRDT